MENSAKSLDAPIKASTKSAFHHVEKVANTPCLSLLQVPAPRDMSDWSVGFTMLGLATCKCRFNSSCIRPLTLPLAACFQASSSHLLCGTTTQTTSNASSRPNRDRQRQKRGRYVKPYFFAAPVAYVLGLVTTVVVMHRLKLRSRPLLHL